MQISPRTSELEISLFPLDGQRYTVEMRFSQSGDTEYREPARGVASFDFEALRGLQLDPAAYGRQLSADLFADPVLRDSYREIRAAAGGVSLRMQLAIAVSQGEAAMEGANRLHDLRWETLYDPLEDRWLLTDESTVFSRYLSGMKWQQSPWRPRGELKALVVIANPKDLAEGKYQVGEQVLAPVDVQDELERARQWLVGLPVDIIASDTAKPGIASLAKIIADLRQGYDVLYLVCHGALLKRQPAGPYLWLENEQGVGDIVSGQALVDQIRDLLPERRPRLVVLASCQSAGTGNERRAADAQGALAALGPLLSQAGVPAVLAMQGDISMTTIAHFLPVFFSELLKDGRLDRAVAVARGAVRGRPDAWMPVLLLRLKGGSLWYTPGFGGERPEFDVWKSLLRNIETGSCTPILGPGLYEAITGSRTQIALQWAESEHYPLDTSEEDDFPRVAQYIVARYDVTHLGNSLRDAFQAAIQARYPETLPEPMRKPRIWTDTQFNEALGAAADSHWSQVDTNPYEILARLRLPLYLTANPGDLLSRALRKAGADPQVRLCPWNNAIPKAAWQYEEDNPTPERPLVYHLFGRMDIPDSLVLTEDEHFDFLIGVTANKSLIPSSVRAALTSTSLLFLGFTMDDWYFRVFFRMIQALEGHEYLGRLSHTTAQLEPDESKTQDAARARRFLEKYFDQGHISLYWGSSEDFLRQLWAQLATSGWTP